jgi:hypothetical protein
MEIRPGRHRLDFILPPLDHINNALIRYVQGYTYAFDVDFLPDYRFSHACCEGEA